MYLNEIVQMEERWNHTPNVKGSSPFFIKKLKSYNLLLKNNSIKILK